MPKQFSIPMTKAHGFGSLPELVRQRESERALERAFSVGNLPLAVIDRPDLYVPIAAMMRVFEDAARSVGDRAFGLNVGADMGHVGFGLWMHYSASAATLGQGLRRAVATARFHQSGGHLALDRQGDFTIWRYHPPRLDMPHIQHSDHIVHPMLRFVGSYLGADWRPAWIELNYPRDAAAETIEVLLPAPVHFGQPAIGVAMPTSCLARSGPRQAWSPLTLLDVEASEGLPDIAEPLKSFFAIAILRLLEGQTDIDGAAAMAGIGVQTLQRCLRREGLTYRDLLALVRSARAKALLRETDLSITEVAFVLGYSDHANFTRAFNRWAGCSPADFRRRAALSPMSLRGGVSPRNGRNGMSKRHRGLEFVA